MDISFVIVNYNLANEVQNCINTILNKVDGIEYEIIVVDNNSPDLDSRELDKVFPKDKFPNLHFFFLPENRGFGSGCNFGASKSSSEIICFLNPDTIVTDNIFSELIGVLKLDKNTAAVGPRSTENKCFDFSAGLFPSICFEILNIFFLGRHIEALYMFLKNKILNNKSYKVDWILGAAVMIKRDVFNKIGGFDDEYFLYFEEMDLFYRIKKLNYKIYYYPALMVNHIGSASTKKDYSFFTKTFYLSKLLYFEKRYGAFQSKVFKYLTFLQVITQLFLWAALLPFFKTKSVLKIKGFWQVLMFYIKNFNSAITNNRFS